MGGRQRQTPNVANVGKNIERRRHIGSARRPLRRQVNAQAMARARALAGLVVLRLLAVMPIARRRDGRVRAVVNFGSVRAQQQHPMAAWTSSRLAIRLDRTACIVCAVYLTPIITVIGPRVNATPAIAQKTRGFVAAAIVAAAPPARSAHAARRCISLSGASK